MDASKDSNFEAFSSPTTVNFYVNYFGLEPAEIYIFEKFIRTGTSILDLGVGAGRTTPYLATKAGNYVGLDYVQAMIDACAARFPKCAFRCTDATDLSEFDDACFDVVVFSFNGIDAISTYDKRMRCFSEVFRVLAPDGLFIFSSHNARFLFNLPSFANAGWFRKGWRLARAIPRSFPLALRLVSSGVFITGEGYYLDPAHGGIIGYCSTPEQIERDIRSVGFELLEIVDNGYPRKVPRYCTSAYYYVVGKPTSISNSLPLPR